MDELITKGEVRTALLSLNLDPITWYKVKSAIGRIPAHNEEFFRSEYKKNEPLTLPELKAFEGKPVFRYCLHTPNISKWKVLSHYGEKMEYIGWADDTHDLFRNYGKDFVCYREPPKELLEANNG